jgi:opacity protein-like surface antigen
LLIITDTGLSQDLNRHEFGFEGGAGISFLRGIENIEKYHDPTLCYAVGISYQYRFTESLSFISALDYERKGSVVNVTATDPSGNPTGEFVDHLNYDYLMLPLLARFSFGNQFKMFINAGPYAGYLIKVTSVTDKNDIVPNTELDLTDDSYKYDFGISAGLGARIPINQKFAFKVEVRNNLGLINTRSVSIEEEVGTVKTNSTNLLLGIAYSF